MTAELTRTLAADLDGGFAALVRAHGADVYSTVLRLGIDRSSAEDLSQETFLRAYRALQGWDGERIGQLRPRPWLTAIAVNLVRNHWRTQARRAATAPAGDAALDGIVDPAPGPDQHAEHREDAARWALALADLPEAQRLTVVLRHVIGLSYAEIAEVLDRPIGTVKAQVSRGVAELRRLHTEEAGR